MHLLISESTHQSEKGSIGLCSVALAWGKLIGLSPLVRGRVDVSRGYNPCFGRVEAPNAPPIVCLSYGQDLDEGPYFLPELVTHTLVGVRNRQLTRTH